MASLDPRNLGEPDGRPLPCDLRKAVEFIRRGHGRKISMVDLVAHCGVAERTLRKHFRAFMDVSPLEYWRRFRLAAAREELLKGSNSTSITEVAMRFGFNHFGRFSGQYRRSFGEKPSTTLRRSWIGERGRVDRIHEVTSIALAPVGRARDPLSPSCRVRSPPPPRSFGFSANVWRRGSPTPLVAHALYLSWLQNPRKVSIRRIGSGSRESWAHGIW